MVRTVLVMVASVVATVSAQTPTPMALNGQKIVTEAPVYWGGNSSSLYVTSTGFLRDSAGQRVALDTAVNGVGHLGACSQTIVIRTSAAITPYSHAEVSVRARATDPSQSGYQLYLAYRYRAPSGSDTSWIVPGRNYIYDSLQVVATTTNPAVSSTFTTSLMNFYPTGQDARVCVARTSAGPGAGDTIVFNNNWFRAW